MEDSERCHPAGNTCLDLTSWDSKNRAAEGLGHVGAKYKSYRSDAGCKLVNLNVVPEPCYRTEVIEYLLSTVEQQHHQNKIRDTADQGGVSIG